MTVKEQLIQELDRLPEPILKEVLEFVLALKTKPPVESETALEKSDVWKAYLASKKERKEVYRRLANS
ncbi:MAG: DUF2281 domain-containing protein [Richelia sp. CSU_2_1]|nr:DUF2281 domain-containing protein [Microcoleus sp. SU_5_6]NJR24849.1 DUF2281 domain-containing protein [Richelia sp. CSU_2_1]